LDNTKSRIEKYGSLKAPTALQTFRSFVVGEEFREEISADFTDDADKREKDLKRIERSTGCESELSSFFVSVKSATSADVFFFFFFRGCGDCPVFLLLVFSILSQESRAPSGPRAPRIVLGYGRSPHCRFRGPLT
jgi:hypothetical protein